MNILLVNPAHPATPHISAVRAWRFAEHLAALGHRVVLLTAASGEDNRQQDVAMDVHDWARPYVLAPSMLASVVSSKAPLGLGKAVTLVRMLVDGGYQSNWLRAAVTAVLAQTATFQPDVVWATFGKMEAVFAARRIARALDCPWVLDLKDNWDLFVPAGLRRLMVWRVRGWSALTANSSFTRQQAQAWGQGDAELVYSGVDDAFIMQAEDERAGSNRFTINLIGSVYFGDRLTALLEGIRRWAAGLSGMERERISLVYLGGDIGMVTECMDRSGLDLDLQVKGYLPVAEMATACRRAAVNAYVAYTGHFHHKLLELLACGRPVLAFPAESDEARGIARQVDGELLEPGDEEAVAAVMSELHARWKQGPVDVGRTRCEGFSWPAQTLVLQETLRRAARH